MPISKKERLKKALLKFNEQGAFATAVAAMDGLRECLRQVETEASGLPDYDPAYGTAGKQLHLFAFRDGSPFWSRLGPNYICQLTSHYAIFSPEGDVAIYSRQGGEAGDLTFQKNNIGSRFGLDGLTGQTVWQR